MVNADNVGKKYQPRGKSYSDVTAGDAEAQSCRRVPVLTPIVRCRRLNGYAGGFPFSFTRLAMTRISSAGSTGFARCAWKPARSARTRSWGCA